MCLFHKDRTYRIILCNNCQNSNSGLNCLAYSSQTLCNSILKTLLETKTVKLYCCLFASNKFAFSVLNILLVLTLATWGWRGSEAWLTLRAKWAEPQKDFSLGGGTEEDTQQRSTATRAERSAAEAMRLKIPPKRQNSPENSTSACADPGG